MVNNLNDYANYFFIEADKTADVVPVISTFSNLVDIIQKIFLDIINLYIKNISKLNAADVKWNKQYYVYLQDKSYLDCVILLVPVFGNIYIKLNRNKIDNVLKNQDFKESAIKKEDTSKLIVPDNFSDSKVPKVTSSNLGEAKKEEKETLNNLPKTNIRSRAKTYAKEAEDIQKRPLKLKRQLSCSNLNTIQLTEKEELEKRSGHLWQCVSRHPNQDKGYIYTFQLKPEYDDITVSEGSRSRANAADECQAQISPAVEISSKIALLYQPGLTLPEFLELFPRSCVSDKLSEFEVAEATNMHSLMHWLHDLGYVCRKNEKGVFFEMPDREALLCRWERLREQNPNLPSLDINSSEGIASDESFTEAFLTDDALLSSNKEFIHDSTAHVIPFLELVLQSKHYKGERGEIVRIIAKKYSKIMILQNAYKKHRAKLTENECLLIEKQLKKMKTVVGIIIDLISSGSDYQDFECFFSERFETALLEGKDKVATIGWWRYMEKHYGVPSPVEIEQTKKIINKLLANKSSEQV